MVASGTKQNYLKNVGYGGCHKSFCRSYRIYLSNNKVVDFAIPLTEEGGLSVERAVGVIRVNGFPEGIILKAGE
eukprot:5817445-Ditylum_brightwellii.AAC.1